MNPSVFHYVVKSKKKKIGVNQNFFVDLKVTLKGVVVVTKATRI